MATQEKAPEERISQFDYALLPEMSAFLGVNALQFVKEIEEKEHRDREKMHNFMAEVTICSDFGAQKNKV